MMGGMDSSGALGIVTVLKYVLITLGSGALLGFIGGKIFAGIRYPNPEKRQLFTAWQKIAVLVVTLASIGLIVAAFVPRDQAEDSMVNAGGAGMADGMEAAQGGDDGVMDTGDGEATAGADGESGNDEASTDSSEGEESASSEAPAGGSANAGATGGGGGGSVTITGGRGFRVMGVG